MQFGKMARVKLEFCKLETAMADSHVRSPTRGFQLVESRGLGRGSLGAEAWSAASIEAVGFLKNLTVAWSDCRGNAATCNRPFEAGCRRFWVAQGVGEMFKALGKAPMSVLGSN